MYSILEQVFLFGTAWLWEYFLSSSRSQNPHHSQLIPKHLFGNYDKFTMIMMTSLEKFAMTTKTYLKKFSMMGKDLLKKFLMTFSIHYQDHHCIANYHHLLWHHHHHQILYLCLIKNDISCWGTDHISVFFFSNTQLCIVIGQKVENFKNNLNWKFGFERCWCYKQNQPTPEFEVETLFWFWQNWKLFLYFCNCVCVFVYFCVSVFLYLSSPLYPEHGHWAATFNNFD